MPYFHFNQYLHRHEADGIGYAPLPDLATALNLNGEERVIDTYYHIVPSLDVHWLLFRVYYVELFLERYPEYKAALREFVQEGAHKVWLTSLPTTEEPLNHLLSELEKRVPKSAKSNSEKQVAIIDIHQNMLSGDLNSFESRMQHVSFLLGNLQVIRNPDDLGTQGLIKRFQIVSAITTAQVTLDEKDPLYRLHKCFVKWTRDNERTKEANLNPIKKNIFKHAKDFLDKMQAIQDNKSHLSQLTANVKKTVEELIRFKKANNREPSLEESKQLLTEGKIAIYRNYSHGSVSSMLYFLEDVLLELRSCMNNLRDLYVITDVILDNIDVELDDGDNHKTTLGVKLASFIKAINSKDAKRDKSAVTHPTTSAPATATTTTSTAVIKIPESSQNQLIAYSANTISAMHQKAVMHYAQYREEIVTKLKELLKKNYSWMQEIAALYEQWIKEHQKEIEGEIIANQSHKEEFKFYLVEFKRYAEMYKEDDFNAFIPLPYTTTKIDYDQVATDQVVAALKELGIKAEDEWTENVVTKAFRKKALSAAPDRLFSGEEAKETNPKFVEATEKYQRLLAGKDLLIKWFGQLKKLPDQGKDQIEKMKRNFNKSTVSVSAAKTNAKSQDQKNTDNAEFLFQEIKFCAGTKKTPDELEIALRNRIALLNANNAVPSFKAARQNQCSVLLSLEFAYAQLLRAHPAVRNALTTEHIIRIKKIFMETLKNYAQSLKEHGKLPSDDHISSRPPFNGVHVFAIAIGGHLLNVKTDSQWNLSKMFASSEESDVTEAKRLFKTFYPKADPRHEAVFAKYKAGHLEAEAALTGKSEAKTKPSTASTQTSSGPKK